MSWYYFSCIQYHPSDVIPTLVSWHVLYKTEMVTDGKERHCSLRTSIYLYKTVKEEKTEFRYCRWYLRYKFQNDENIIVYSGLPILGSNSTRNLVFNDIKLEAIKMGFDGKFKFPFQIWRIINYVVNRNGTDSEFSYSRLRHTTIKQQVI